MVDRVIQKKHPRLRSYITAGVIAIAAVLAAYSLLRSRPSQLNVQKDRITITTVSSGPFAEYITVDAVVMPLKTIYLDAVEGGRVAERYAEDGELVKAGQPILKLVNTDLQLDFLQRETQAFDLINNLQNAKNSLEQNRVNRLSQLAEAEYQLREAERNYEINDKLYKEKMISRQEYLQFRNNYDYQKRRRQLIEMAIVRDSVSTHEQMKQMRESYARMQSNLALMRQKTSDLIVKAPATGQLSSFRAEIGELKSKGQNLGQLDIMNGFKVRAQIDEHYIGRVQSGVQGECELGGKSYALTVKTIYPQVSNGRFDADLTFSATQPAGLRKGQNLQISLRLGEPREAVFVQRGGFYQSTGGSWIYVLSSDGSYAEKRTIRTGRQNPEHLEILEGLAPGEQVITSSYESIGDYERIQF